MNMETNFGFLKNFVNESDLVLPYEGGNFRDTDNIKIYR